MIIGDERGRPCTLEASMYGGTHAASEPEVRAMADYILSLKHRLLGIDVHILSQFILRNLGSDEGSCSPKEAVLKALGDRMKSAIQKTTSTHYESMTGAECMW